jgi:chemotaxis methyl-accepting protein methylase
VPADIQVQREIIQLFQDSLNESKKLRIQASESVNNADEYLKAELFR